MKINKNSPAYSKGTSDLPVVIVGAGPTGIGAALRLQELGVPWRILEKENHPGGLASSFPCDGFTWDVGGHVIFSHYDTYSRLLEQAIPAEQWLFHPRIARVRIGGNWVPYPFQLHLADLPQKERLRCENGLNRARCGPTDRSNFSTYMDSHFGEGITALFMRPYNRKIWAHPLDKMSVNWIGERVAKMNDQVVVGKNPGDWGPNRKFRFPLSGGTGAIWCGAADLLDRTRLHLGTKVEGINLPEHCLTTSSGNQIPFSALISTMPIDLLCQVSQLNGYEEQISKLVHTSVHVVGLGIKREIPESIKDVCWMYFPDDEFPFYRATVFSQYSPNNTPPGTWSLMLELSESATHPLGYDDPVHACVQACITGGLVNHPADVIHKWHHRAEYGYPVPTLERDNAIGTLNEAFESYDIYSRGRFGAWKYEIGNMDHSFMQGWEMANRLVHGTIETTVNNPDKANRINIG